MPDAICITMITSTNLRNTVGVTHILNAFEKHPKTVPTHWGTDERARQPYNREEMISIVSDFPNDTNVPGLHRRKSPRYQAYFTAKQHDINNLKIEYRSAIDEPNLPVLFALGNALAEHLHPVFGFVHSIWDLGEQSQKYSEAGITNVRDFQEYGPQAPCTRTWFGPHLVDLIGREVLLGCDAPTTETAWGGIQLDLIDTPWEADFATLQQRQQQILQQLLPSGVFGDYSQPFEYQPGPRWVPVSV
ncbi:MAG: hypothetical protein GFH27_549293n105 [Chloroflexi bacterium AL-W]|nr:hypothetical protein [Chloroflexi bacterium AL-N1]NOK67780.1 hypothetical protein [Chloroflexi bacterium AL-N10]NOK75450.1 hypothetical protein [Chloroflexi bacterium AL-N5]NOK82238.1 hypothetical protein [Chloroflexi bacterium AL-W]NOK90083.1 hypothetical protein [Chloroflexi bacterium AL-N15]